jgi:hypothetical protein
MSQGINLKEAERKAFRFTFQDGLWDIYLGLLLLIMGMGPVISDLEVLGLWPVVALMVLTLLVMLAFWAGKRFITTPRIGLVRFGPARKAKIKYTGVILSLSVLVGVIVLVVGLAAGSNPPAWISWGWIIPAGVFGMTAVVVFSLGAYWLDFQRAYVYGWLYALAFPTSIMLVEYAGITFPIAYAVSAGIMILVGVILLLRFLRDYPIPAGEA